MRFERIDLRALVAEGKGNKSFIGLKPTCVSCGKKGKLQVRPQNTMIGDGSPDADSQ